MMFSNLICTRTASLILALVDIVLAGGKSTLYAIQGGARVLSNFAKEIRLAVNDSDLASKGFHIHFENEAFKGLEMRLKTLNNDKIGLETVVFPKNVSAATLVRLEKSAVSLFEKAIATPEFRNALIVKLTAAREYLKDIAKFQQSINASNKAMEFNFLIQNIRHIK